MSSSGAGVPLPHSQSTPSGMCPAPSSPPDGRSLGKRLSVQVHFLDDSVANFNIQFKALGKVLFDQVCKLLNLLETDYFGLEYVDSFGTKFWLDYEKPMCRQMGLSMLNPVMNFCVKFYTPDPAQLEEEYTRYLFSLQIKRDLAQAVLQCNENTAALMASYIVQAECGDFVSDDYPDHNYVASFKFVPHQDAEFQHKIMENHKKHTGQSPAEADLNLLETSRRCELYGIKMTSAKDSEGVPLNLAVAHMGILVFQNYTKINTFSWAKIRKISFKRKRFLIKLHPEGFGYYKDTVEFIFESRNECKNFWRKCIENHAFFRCIEVKPQPRQKTRIFSRGSSFRYSGRTQKQMVEFVRENYVKRQPFQRSNSLRVQSVVRRGLGLVGTSLSAQPLLPVSSSQSCGSVNLSHNVGDITCSPIMKPMSESQPSSPRIILESTRMVANGAVCNEGRGIRINRQDAPPGLISPEFAAKAPSFGSAEFRDIDNLSIVSDDLSIGRYSDDHNMTDDNTSHDSYMLDHKHSISDSAVYKNCCDDTAQSDSKSDNVYNVIPENPLLAFRQRHYGSEEEVEQEEERDFVVGNNDEKGVGNPGEDTVEVTAFSNTREGDNNTVSINGDITYILHKRNTTRHSTASPPQKPKSPKPVLRVEMEHSKAIQGSPTLFARASCFSTAAQKKHGQAANLMRSKTVDFVHVHQLPAADGFSSQDDSLEDSFVGKAINRRTGNKKRTDSEEADEDEGTQTAKDISDSQEMDTVIANQDGFTFATDELTDSIEILISKNKNRNKSERDDKQKEEEDGKIQHEEEKVSARKQFFTRRSITRSFSIEKSDEEELKAKGNKRHAKEVWLNENTDEFFSSSSSGSGILYSGSCSSLDDMLQLSDIRLYDTHLSSSEDDATVAEDDDEFHLDAEGVGGLMEAHGKFNRSSSFDDSNCEETPEEERSFHDGMDVLEDITEHTETFSEDETAQMIDDGLSCTSMRSVESLCSSTPSRNHMCLEEELLFCGSQSSIIAKNQTPTPPYTRRNGHNF